MENNEVIKAQTKQVKAQAQASSASAIDFASLVERVYREEGWVRFGRFLQVRSFGPNHTIKFTTQTPGTNGKWQVLIVKEDFEALGNIFLELSKWVNQGRAGGGMVLNSSSTVGGHGVSQGQKV